MITRTWALRGLAAIAIFLPLRTMAAETLGVTTIHIGSKVIQRSVQPFGINLGALNFYDSGQMLKNLLGRNPGFEGEIYQSLAKCVSGTDHTCVDEERYSAWPAGFWKNASFEIISGAAKGRTGKVIDSSASDTKTGGVIRLDGSGRPIGPGDYLILRNTHLNRPEAGWSPRGKGTFEPERHDLPPHTKGKQALRLNTMRPEDTLSLNAYFDGHPKASFVQLKGKYRLTFSAKRTGGSGKVEVHLFRSGSAPFLQKTIELTNQWATYTLDFNAAENSAARGTCEINFYLGHGIILLDDVSLEKIDGDPTNNTVFADPVVAALRELKPGILRYWAYQLGETLDNQIVPAGARQRSGYSTFQTEQEDIQYGLEDFLELCNLIHAEPWYVIPTTFSTVEMANLIEYLQGDERTPYGSRRAARGRAAPWTEAFSAIHLEFGNEAWNSAFRGGTIEDPITYGKRAAEMFRAARGVKGYKAEKFDLILGGQEVYLQRNRDILSAAAAYDTFTVAAYISEKVDSDSNTEDLFGPLFAEAQAAERDGIMRKNLQLVQSIDTRPSLAVYELNMGTLQGSISQAALDRYTPSLGAGLAIASHMLMMLRDLGIHNQLIWQLPQFDFARPDHKTVRLWGAVVDMGVTNRRRPEFLALEALNRVLLGDMVETRHTGADPVWDQPLVNGTQLKGAHYLQSFAFSNGASRAVALLNLHRSSELAVNFEGDSIPRGPVDVERLSSNAITDTNEDGDVVRLSRRRLERFDPAKSFTLPPFSLTVLRWPAFVDRQSR